MQKTLNVMTKIKELVSNVEKIGFKMDGSSQMNEAILQIKAIAEEIEHVWPDIDRKMIELSMASYTGRRFHDD